MATGALRVLRRFPDGLGDRALESASNSVYRNTRRLLLSGLFLSSSGGTGTSSSVTLGIVCSLSKRTIRLFFLCLLCAFLLSGIDNRLWPVGAEVAAGWLG